MYGIIPEQGKSYQNAEVVLSILEARRWRKILMVALVVCIEGE